MKFSNKSKVLLEQLTPLSSDRDTENSAVFGQEAGIKTAEICGNILICLCSLCCPATGSKNPKSNKCNFEKIESCRQCCLEKPLQNSIFKLKQQRQHYIEEKYKNTDIRYIKLLYARVYVYIRARRCFVANVSLEKNSA